MKLLITGAAGQLGQAFGRELKSHPDIVAIACSRSDLDITDVMSVGQLITREQPDFVINTAAYTQVDLAESEAETAYLINQTGPANLAQVCQDLGIPLIHFSTDCVFDGSKHGLWTEIDPTLPLSVYGASKLAGEEAVQQLCDKHLIFRVSWVFSEFGHNFVKTMLDLGSTRHQLRVVNDQVGKPTCAREIAKVVLNILPKLHSQWGIYHLAQAEVISWYRFARAVFNTAERHQTGTQLIVKELLPISTSDYPSAAKRPANSALDTTKLQQTFGLVLTDWQYSLNQTFSALESKVPKFHLGNNDGQNGDQTSE